MPIISGCNYKNVLKIHFIIIIIEKKINKIVPKKVARNRKSKSRTQINRRVEIEIKRPWSINPSLCTDSKSPVWSARSVTLYCHVFILITDLYFHYGLSSCLYLTVCNCNVILSLICCARQQLTHHSNKPVSLNTAVALPSLIC